jgi:hypothetical protein
MDAQWILDGRRNEEGWVRLSRLGASGGGEARWRVTRNVKEVGGD